jgi:nucleoside-diphosphate-sugar epimerase
MFIDAPPVLPPEIHPGGDKSASETKNRARTCRQNPKAEIRDLKRRTPRRLKILVTGAAGYIGSVLADELLAHGHEVTAVDSFSRGKTSLLPCCRHRSFKFLPGDVRDAALMRSLLKDADAIIALAALVSPQSCVGKADEAHDINVRSIRTLNDLRSPSQPLLFMSTNIGYGTKERKEIYTEEDPLQPNSIYGQTKVEAEKIIMGKDGFVIYRPASAFGISPRMQDHLLLNYYVSKAVEDGQLVVYDASCKRNFIHVRDVSRALIHTLDHYARMKNQVYNLGISDAGTTKLALAERIKQHLGALPIFVHDQATDPDGRNYLVSNAKIERHGFKCQFTVDDGIRELLGYYRMRKLVQ